MLKVAEVSTLTVESIRGLLDTLYTRIPLKLWMVTTVNDDDWTIVYAHNRGYDADEGTVLSWRESFCCRMMKGEGPQFATHVDECAAYINAPIGKKMPIKAYVGVPLFDDNEQLIGTLCGIDPEPDVTGIRSGEALVRQTAALVGRLISMEMQISNQRNLAGKWSDAAHRDVLTGLLNRRGWDQVIAQTIAQKSHEIHGVIICDLDCLKEINDRDGHPAGDLLIQRIASVLTVSMRGQDVVARLGGDEFGILLRCDDQSMVNAVRNRIECELAQTGIAASTGIATVPPESTLAAAFLAADTMMMAQKAAKKAVQ